MFLLLYSRHVGAHASAHVGRHRHGVSIQSSISSSETLFSNNALTNHGINLMRLFGIYRNTVENTNLYKYTVYLKTITSQIPYAFCHVLKANLFNFLIQESDDVMRCAT